MLWNLIIAYFISAQINAGSRSKSGRNLKLELLSGDVAGWWGEWDGGGGGGGDRADAYLQTNGRKRPESVFIRSAGGR